MHGHLWSIFHLMMRQMFSTGERSGQQAGQFSTRTLLLRSHAVVIAAVCGFALSRWTTRPLKGSICCSKTFIYFSAFIVPSKTCWMNEWLMHLYSALLCVAVHPKRFTIMWGSLLNHHQCAASTWMNMQAAHAICTPILSEMLAFELKADDTLEGLPPL